MNYILFCSKGEIKQYKEFFKSAANSTLLAAENVLTTDKIDQIKDEYNPHGIIIAGMEIDDVKTAVKYAADAYGDLTIILIHPGINNTDIEYLNQYTHRIITRAITAEDFTYIIDNSLGAYEYEILNQKTPGKKNLSVKKDRGKISFIANPKFLVIGAAAIAVIFLLLAVSTCSSGEDENDTDVTEVTSATKPLNTGLVTEPSKPTERETEYAVFTSPSFTQPTANSEETEEDTEKPTEKETNKPSSSGQTQQSQQSPQVQTPQGGQNSSAPVQTPQQPVYEEAVTDPPAVSSQPYTPPQSSTPVIVDDGKIYLDPTTVTLKVGDSYDIYVSGLSAANGCNWDVQNAAVADFVNGDTTKVTIKATGVGVTVITATSKSSGATAQCVVTVKK